MIDFKNFMKLFKFSFSNDNLIIIFDILSEFSLRKSLSSNEHSN